jgi:hypothetical protein
MFSVIIPTMWKFKPFLDFVQDMVMQPSVGEVIIIDNAPDDKPDHIILSHPKIKIHCFGRNIFVNPAWNFGAAMAENDRLCILNDDLIFDLKLFNKMIPHIVPWRGAYGISPGVPDTGQIPVTTGTIDIIHSPDRYHYRTHLGFGQLMMCHKANWVPIIDGLELYWGDNFIYDTQYYKFDQNYLITNMFHYTPYAATTSKLEGVSEMYNREHIIYNQEMPAIEDYIRRNSHINWIQYNGN